MKLFKDIPLSKVILKCSSFQNILRISGAVLVKMIDV